MKILLLTAWFMLYSASLFSDILDTPMFEKDALLRLVLVLEIYSLFSLVVRDSLISGLYFALNHLHSS
jgi:hypothetical protein